MFVKILYVAVRIIPSEHESRCKTLYIGIVYIHTAWWEKTLFIAASNSIYYTFDVGKMQNCIG